MLLHFLFVLHHSCLTCLAGISLVYKKGIRGMVSIGNKESKQGLDKKLSSLSYGRDKPWAAPVQPWDWPCSKALKEMKPDVFSVQLHGSMLAHEMSYVSAHSEGLVCQPWLWCPDLELSLLLREGIICSKLFPESRHEGEEGWRLYLSCCWVVSASSMFCFIILLKNAFNPMVYWTMSRNVSSSVLMLQATLRALCSCTKKNN